MKSQLAFLCWVAFAGTALAASEPMLQKNPLKKLPSKPGPHIANIKAMKPGTCLDLGSPAADPKWGRARGRSWGGHAMVLAPEFRGAMYTGEGVHAFTKPDGYGMDDWWFYDINAHAWICVWPGTNTRELGRQVKEGKIKVDEKGRAVDGSGQPVPAHILVHTYHLLTYNSDDKKFAVMGTYPTFIRYYMPGLGRKDPKPVRDSCEEAIKTLEAQGLKRNKSNTGPWTYDMKTGRFAFEGKKSIGNTSLGMFEYIPKKKKYILLRRDKCEYLDPATGTLSEAVKTPLGGAEYIGCYDAKRNRVYCGNRGDRFCCVDLKDNSVTRIEFPKSETHLLKKGSMQAHRASAVFDVANDRALIVLHSGQIYPIDPETNKVLKPLAADAKEIRTSKRRGKWAVFYDPELAVTFIFTAGDSRDDGRMWVYKYKKEAAVDGDDND